MTRPQTPACRAFLERLSRYVDDELPRRDQRITARHLRECPCCLDLIEGLKQTVTLCRAAGHRRLPVAVRARAQARIAQLLAEPAIRVRTTR